MRTAEPVLNILHIILSEFTESPWKLWLDCQHTFCTLILWNLMPVCLYVHKFFASERMLKMNTCIVGVVKSRRSNQQFNNVGIYSYQPPEDDHFEQNVVCTIKNINTLILVLFTHRLLCWWPR
jgi:hypothetical protein